MEKNNFYSVGIINITPDSFSDGGRYNSEESFKVRVSELLKNKCNFFDVGAESSAPSNQAISAEEEISRFEQCLIPNLNLFPSGANLSIDTYKHETIRKVLARILSTRTDLNLVWNDVSGVLDRDVTEILDSIPTLGYVYGHTHINERSETLQHMDRVTNYVSNFEFMNSVKGYFFDGLVRLSKYKNRVILDPGFGFSKSYEQNIHLIKNIIDLVSMAPDSKWMLGISRKSFLKKSIFNPEINIVEQSELLQMAIVTRWMEQLKKKPNDILIRLHDVTVFENAQKFRNIFS